MAAGIAVLTVALGIDLAARYLPAVRALQDGRDAAVQARQLLTTDVDHLDASRVAQVKALLDRARADFGERSRLVGDGWVAGIAAGLPFAGNQVRAARAMRTAGSLAVRLGEDVIPLLTEVLPRGPGPHQPVAALVRASAGHGEVLARVRGDLDALHGAVASLPSDPLVGPLDQVRSALHREESALAGSLGPATALLQSLPSAVGPGRHEYLLLLCNPGEERPGGGYIGAIGDVSFADGQLSGADFVAPEQYDPLVSDTRAPRPLDVHLYRGHPWDLENANWSPDFPTSAAQISALYQRETGRVVDGVVALDPVAVEHALEVLGAVAVPPYPQVIAPPGVLWQLNHIVNGTGPEDAGKAFLPPFGHAALDKLLSAPARSLPSLAEALRRAASEKHLVVWARDAALEGVVRGGGIGGAVTSPLGDALQVVDANLSGSKADLYVRRAYSLTAVVQPDGQVHDHLTLTYQNPVVTSPADRQLDRPEGSALGEYRDYVRIYVPETATLEDARLGIGGAVTPLSPEEVTYEFQRQSIAFWVSVPYGATAVLEVDYGGPFADATTDPVSYSLLWEKQINALSWPISVTVQGLHGSRTVGDELAADRHFDSGP